MKLNKDEANREYHVNGKNRGASEDTSSGQDNDNPNTSNGDDNVNCMDNGNVDGDVCVAVDDDEDEDLENVDRCARGNHPGDCIVVDWLKGDYCIKCNSRNGKVLVCIENGCPIAFHEACMTWKPDIDDKGKFYCPYCLFKQEGARVKELRMKSRLAGKELSNFICLRRGNGSEEKQEGEKPLSKEKSNEQTAHGFDNVENEERIEEVEEEERVNLEGASVSALAKKVSSGDCGKGLDNDDKETSHHNHDEQQNVELLNKEKSDKGNISRADGFENVENGERMQEYIENSSDSEDEDASPDLVGETLVAGQKHDKLRVNKAQTQKVVSPDKSSFQPGTSAKKRNMNREGNTRTTKISVKQLRSTKRLTIPVMDGTEKRRRLYWTAEEEDMLRELVHEFSSKVNKNIPWRKILEHGRSVFHSTRLPADLKDKWKNIVAKEISKD